MKRIVWLVVLWMGAMVFFQSSWAEETSGTKQQPDLADRIADLEAYINNGAPVTAGADYQKTKTPGPIASVPGPGHNGWMMVCSALVLFMTLPGLALFYGGLVRSKNILSVLAQCLGITGVVTLIWWLCGYSLVFGTNYGDKGLLGLVYGGSEYFLLNGVGSTPNAGYSAWISQSVFCMYQLMFAIITPALIIGAIAERMKFSSVIFFVILWMFLVYFPLAHMVWGVTGCMNGVWNANASIKAIDFAGGTVVHMSSGWSALVLCILLGKRIGFGKQPLVPHNLVLCMIGTGMLWVGWYGFNAGSALAADGIAANAFMTTTLATAIASFTWALIEYMKKGTPSILGFCSGAVGGLVVITPACGFVDSTGAVLMGVLAGAIPYFACTKIKSMFGYDDALDTFGVHAVGGTLGAFLTGIFANPDVNPNLNTNLKGIMTTLWKQQSLAMILTIALACVATVIIAQIVKSTIGLRAAPEVEEQGLDIKEHGEEAYNS